jgi:hypothetical protein
MGPKVLFTINILFMKRKINLLIIGMLFLMGFTACEDIEKPGGIPGMGNTPGELEIEEPFVAPDGITIDVEGMDLISVKGSDGLANLKSPDGWDWGRTYGWGGSYHGREDTLKKFVFWVTVKLTINNLSNSDISFTLPKGTVFKVSDQKAQNGITLEDVTFSVEAKKDYQCQLMLMCLNKGRHGSDADLSYEILGTTASGLLKDLIGYLQNKKIAIENYLIVDGTENNLKSISTRDFEKYKEISNHVQNLIWKLTNDGKELSQEDMEYFHSLPDIN